MLLLQVCIQDRGLYIRSSSYVERVLLNAPYVKLTKEHDVLAEEMVIVDGAPAPARVLFYACACLSNLA